MQRRSDSSSSAGKQECARNCHALHACTYTCTRLLANPHANTHTQQREAAAAAAVGRAAAALARLEQLLRDLDSEEAVAIGQDGSVDANVPDSGERVEQRKELQACACVLRSCVTRTHAHART